MNEATAARLAVQPIAQARILIGEDFQTLQDTIYQTISACAYSRYEARGREDGYDLDDWYNAQQQLGQVESLEVIDTGSEIRIRARAKSLDGSRTAVGVSPQRVVILGERVNTESALLKGGASSQATLLQVIDLVPLVDPSRATARLSGGLLEITIPQSR
jgi:HSP20 family molecular chaperone IbpA